MTSFMEGDEKFSSVVADDRLVVLNSTARAVVDARRWHHSTHVFAYDDGSGFERPIQRMFTSGWIRARERAELGHVRVMIKSTPSVGACAQPG
jgi:hypothetical protein